jgi:hypothetical protein
MAKSLTPTTDSLMGAPDVTNPNYQIWISKGGTPICTPMPENWTTNFDISWAPQFANILQDAAAAVMGAAKADLVTNMMSASGYRPINKSLSSNIWQGTSYVTLNIPFFFKVENNAEEELLKPIRTLLEWSLPSETNGMMKAPYSPLVQVLKQDYTSITDFMGIDTHTVKSVANSPITVKFGKFFTLEECVITNISQTYDSIFNSAGCPLSAKIDLSVTSCTVITTTDLGKMYPLMTKK